MPVVGFIVLGMDIVAEMRSLHPVQGVELCQVALTSALGKDAWSLSDDDLTTALSTVETARARLDALALRLVREGDARDLAGRVGAPSMAAWLRHRHRVHPAEACETVKLARALAGSSGATAEALASGSISRRHTEVIADALAKLPDDLPSELLDQGETFLLEQASLLDPQQLRRLGNVLHETVAPADAERRLGERLARDEAKATQKRAVSFTSAGDGLETAHIRLESAQMVKLEDRARPAGPAAAD